LAALAVPPGYWTESNSLSLFLASIGGALVGVTELSGRYRDEPLGACMTPFGLLYLIVNGAISFFAALLIIRYPKLLPVAQNDHLLLCLVAGFGASAIMRAKVSVFKGTDDKEIAIGLDVVIKALLNLCDKGVDRLRASVRNRLVISHLPKVMKLGAKLAGPNEDEFALVTQYFIVTLLSFQNPDVEARKSLEEGAKYYKAQPMPKELKYSAFCFLLLNLVGEQNFRDAFVEAERLEGTPGATAPPGPGVPDTAAQPRAVFPPQGPMPPQDPIPPLGPMPPQEPVPPQGPTPP
jgi:hypothetical protein